LNKQIASRADGDTEAGSESGEAERRRFTRIALESKVRITSLDGIWWGDLIDISLKGLLVRVSAGWPGKTGDRYTVQLQLDEGDTIIQMEGRVIHREGERLGFGCESIDLDSFSHLKRLLQLNLEDEAQLLRELEELG
jgi:PilZ domain